MLVSAEWHLQMSVSGILVFVNTGVWRVAFGNAASEILVLEVDDVCKCWYLDAGIC